MLLGILAALAAGLAYGLAAVLQASAARREETATDLDPLLLVRLLRYPAFLAAVALNLGGFLGHLLALRTAPLFLAQALIASSVGWTAVIVARWWTVRLSRTEQAAVAFLVLGLTLLSVAAKESTTPVTTAAERAWLLGVCAALAVLGAVAARWRAPASAPVLGLLAGVGYAVVAVSGQVVPSFAPSRAVADPAVWALVVAGVLAFLLYSTALQRGAVLASTSTMIVVQTGGPAVVGVVLLGNSVRDGWWPAAVGGFVVSVGAALALARKDPAVLERPPVDGPVEHPVETDPKRA